MEDRIGIGLSGGGFRATLYNLGALIRLNEFGILAQLARISSVSGGTITSAVLANHWNNLNFENSIASNLQTELTEPIRDFCSDNFDVGAVLSGIFSFRHSIADKVAAKYDRRLFHGSTLGDLANNKDAPQFLFYGTSLQTQSAVRMVDGIYYDWRIGAVEIPGWSLGRVVGISSAFPPVLAPVKIDFDKKDWEEATYSKFYKDTQFKEQLILADGGVYDNMGMESLWKKSYNKLKNSDLPINKVLDDDMDYCLISDAGGPTKAKAAPRSNWISVTLRTLNQTVEQSRAVRKRWLIDKYISNQLKGCYWGITTKIENYGVDCLIKDSDLTRALADVPTRLKRFDDKTKDQLINWGYALTDAGVRKHCPELILHPEEGKLPYPDAFK